MMCGSYPTIKALRAKAKPVLPRILARMEGKGIDSNAILFFPDLPAKKKVLYATIPKKKDMVSVA